MSQSKDKSFYLDWICRVHEEGCHKHDRQLSEDGREALEDIWSEMANYLVERPEMFRLRRAAAYRMLLEAGALMAKSAELSGSMAIGEQHVRSGTRALNALRGGNFLAAGDICDVIKVCDPAVANSIVTRTDKPT